MADGDRLRLNGEALHRALPPLRQHVVEQHGVHAPDHQIAVRMHVVVVRHGAHPEIALGPQQDFVGDRAAERRDPLAAKIGEGSESRGVAVADAQHLAEFVVGQRDRHRRPPGRRVFDPAQADVGVAAGDALVDRIEADVEELGRPAEASGEKVRRFRRRTRRVDRDATDRLRQTARRLPDRLPSEAPAAPGPRPPRPARPLAHEPAEDCRDNAAM